MERVPRDERIRDPHKSQEEDALSPCHGLADRHQWRDEVHAASAEHHEMLRFREVEVLVPRRAFPAQVDDPFEAVVRNESARVDLVIKITRKTHERSRRRIVEDLAHGSIPELDRIKDSHLLDLTSRRVQIEPDRRDDPLSLPLPVLLALSPSRLERT